jgi:glutamyl-tRNA reductase
LAQRQLVAGKDPEQVMNELARTLTNKLVHEPCVQINRAAYDGREDVLDTARELFSLKDKD